MASTDGKVSIGVELDDKDAAAQASRLGKEVGSGIEGGIRGGTEKSGGLLNTLKGKFSMAFAAIGGIVAGFSMAQMAAEIVSTGKKFEESMSKVAALSGATGDDLARLEEKARELGATTTFSASEAADALGYMALAGWDTEQMLDGVGDVLTLAQAGMMDLGQASDLVTDYLSAFGMESSETGRMVDVLAYAQANANTTVEGLGMAFKNAAANAHAAGLDVETTTAAISMLANQGLKGSEAGTALTAVMRDMTAKMEDGAIAIGDASVAVMDSQGNYRDFTDILADVEAATNGMGDAERSAALMTTFTADSIKGLNLMLNAGSGQLKSFRAELYGSAGAGKALADTMTDNLEGDIKALNSALEELQLKIYDALKEPLRDVTQFTTGVVIPALTFLVQNFDKLGPVLAALGVSVVSYAKGWDIATAAQKLATKATEAGSKVMTTYKKSVVNGQEAIYKLDKATGQYVRTGKTLTTTIATSTAGMTAQRAAVMASNAAMGLATKAAGFLSTALKTMAPMAVLSVIMSIADSFSKSAEEAETFERATRGLTDANSKFAEAMDSASASVDDYSSSVDDVIAANKSVISSQADLADAIADTWSETGGNVGLVQKYTDTIERLTRKYDENGRKAKLTASEQAELQAAVSGLNTVTGSTYAIIDAVNGELDVSTDRLMENSEAWVRNAKAQAAQEMLVEVQRKQIDVRRQLEETNKALEESEKGVGLYIGDFPVLADDAGVATHELEGQRSQLEESSQALADEEQYLLGVIGDTTGATGEASDAAGEAAGAYGDEAEAAGEAAGATESLAKASEETVKAVQNAAGESAAFAAAMARSGYDAESLAVKLDSMGISADDLAKNVESLAAKTGNAFEEIEQKSDISLDKMMETLVKNRQATENWASNITALYAKAGSDSERQFIQYLSNMGPEYAPILQQLVDDSSGKLTELANEWAHGMEVGTDAALLQANIGRNEVVNELGNGVVPAGEAGEETAQGYADGIDGTAPVAVQEGRTMSQETLGSIVASTRERMPLFKAEAVQGTKSAMDAAKTEGTKGGYAAGTAAGDSEASGLSSRSQALYDTGKGVAGRGASGSESANGNNGAYFKAGSGAGGSYSRGLSSQSGAARSAGSSIGSGAASAMDRSRAARSSGVNVGQGFIGGMNSTLSGVVGAARRMAQSAIDTIKQVGREGSPWRTTIESGEFAGEGLAVGMERSESLVRNRAGRLSRTAVDGINSEAGSDGIAWDTTKRSGRAAARGLVVGFEAADPMAQIEASIEKGVSAMAIAANAGSMSSTTNNQTVNFNQPVQSPDQVARAMRMQQRYGLAGRR